MLVVDAFGALSLIDSGENKNGAEPRAQGVVSATALCQHVVGVLLFHFALYMSKVYFCGG